MLFWGLHISWRPIAPAIIILVLLLSGCSPTRHIPDNEYLLYRIKINADSKDIDKLDIARYSKQNPNKTVLGLKFHLGLYNLANPEKNNRITRWLRKIGDEPEIFDELLADQTTEQFEKYLNNKGYLHAKVTDSIQYKGKKAIVSYTLQLNNPYRIKLITYEFKETGIRKIILDDTVNCLFKIGDHFNRDVLSAERLRMEEYMKNNGYYRFSKDYISYTAIETKQPDWVELKVSFNENLYGKANPITKIKYHYPYKINKTYIYPNYLLNNKNNDTSLLKSDTVILDNNNYIIYNSKHNIKPASLILPNLCEPGTTYKFQNVKKTNANFSSLGLYRIIDIKFHEDLQNEDDTASFQNIDCHIELTPRKSQAIHTELVGTNTAGDLGIRGNLSYNNYNLFKGAENFQIKLTGAIENLDNQYNGTLTNLHELGIETQLTFAKFLVPFRVNKFAKKFNPKTLLTLGFNHQNHPYYIRDITSTTIGYQWKGNSNNKHLFSPLELNMVRMVGGVNEEFLKLIEGTAQENNFVDHAIMNTRYVFEFSNQDIQKKKDFIFVRVGAETAGNLVNWLTKDNPGFADSVPFSQYLKTDFDFRINKQITLDNRIVYRFYAGVGYPISTTQSLPLEKVYSGGGPEGIRAWVTRTLGPGSDTSSTGAYDFKVGDMRLEANLEYRFKLFWDLEGALFVDAGNIWTMREFPDQPGGSFDFKRFYKEIAVGTGLGFRYDFSFLLLRTDFGYKLRDPIIQTGNHWIDWNKEYREEIKTDIGLFNYRFTFQFSIGYPF